MFCCNAVARWVCAGLKSHIKCCCVSEGGMRVCSFTCHPDASVTQSVHVLLRSEAIIKQTAELMDVSLLVE